VDVETESTAILAGLNATTQCDNQCTVATQKHKNKNMSSKKARFPNPFMVKPLGEAILRSNTLICQWYVAVRIM